MEVHNRPHEIVDEVVDLVHSLVLQSRTPLPSSLSTTCSGFEDNLSTSSPAPMKIKIKSVPNSPCGGGISRTQSLPVRKKVQIKSAPLKPPDINNSSLFPSVEETALIDASSSSPSPRRMLLKTSVVSSNSYSSSPYNSPSVAFSGSENAFSLSNLTQDKKFQTLEAKLTEPLQSSPSAASYHRRASLNISELPTTPSRKTPRSAKLFGELSSERRQHLDNLAEQYAKSIDSNQCRNILDELEFLFQLFNTSTSSPSTVMPPSTVNGGAVKTCSGNSSVPLLSSTAEQAYFVIKVVINQLDKLFVSIPPFVLQLIIDNYPHKIPKPVRKHIEDWIANEKAAILNRASRTTISVNSISGDLAKTVTFQSEKDGRSNFLHQTDFHAFCKQRDLFYSIRESWANSGGSNSSSSGVILDRSKSRMSFPPPAPVPSGGGGGSSSYNSTRFVDTLPFKVQSLFQMNSNPTNLFHMASLFVSHFLLEARALEVGGVPKDDNMKEFFQSNPTKLLQLNSRFSMSTAVAETLESDSGAYLAFQKQFLLASSPKFVQHVVDRLVRDLVQAEDALGSTNLSDPGQICRTVKDTVHLARLLGHTHFLPYLPDESKQHNNVPINSIEKESVLQQQAQFRTHHIPPLDLKSYLEKACQSGRLTSTCPWIIEYLLQCDPVALSLPSYQPILKALLSLYKHLVVAAISSAVSPSHPRSKSLTVANRNFLRFHLGMLFGSKNFPDKVFSLLKTPEELTEIAITDDNNPVVIGDEGLVDLLEELAHGLVEFFFDETFKRFKRILSWGKLEVSHPAITGEFRHIRPIPASSGSSSSDLRKSSLTTLSKEKILQGQLEATFFELYPLPVKRSVEFIAERMSANFVSTAKAHWFPTLRTLLQNQGIFGVRAAEKCRVRIAEEMNKFLNDRCTVTVKLFLEQTVTPGVLGLCQKIAIRKAKEAGSEWIKKYINSAMFPDAGGTDGGNSITSSQSSTSLAAKPTVLPEDPPFEILILIHRTLRKLHSSQKIDFQLIDRILSCPSLSQAPWVFMPLIDWGMALITFQPQALNPIRTRQLVAHWKSLWASSTSVSSKILNPRNLLLLNKSDNSRDSWIKLGSVTQVLIAEGLIKADDLEQQCMQLLRENWPDQVHKRISEFLTIVLESFHERAEYHASDSAQVLDWVAWLCSAPHPDQD